jgi:flagellar hook-associated protein 2
VGSGSISFTVNGETTVVDLTEPVNSLADLRDAINNAGAGVNASILNDGSDTSPYRLILTSAESGADAAFTYDFSGLSGGTTPTFTNVTTAADASLSIDSIPITSASNSVSQAITGLTFDLRQAEAGVPINVDIATDHEGIQENIQAFVDAYNDLFSFIETTAAKDGTLENHPAVRTVARRMQHLFALPLAATESELNMLAQVGISQSEGKMLAFDTVKFATALSENFADVRDLFVERGTNLGKAYLIRTSIDDLTDPVDGVFKISEKSLQAKMGNIDDTILRYERSVDNYETMLERKFTAMEGIVSSLYAQGNYLMSVLGYNSLI